MIGGQERSPMKGEWFVCQDSSPENGEMDGRSPREARRGGKDMQEYVIGTLMGNGGKV